MRNQSPENLFCDYCVTASAHVRPGFSADRGLRRIQLNQSDKQKYSKVPMYTKNKYLLNLFKIIPEIKWLSLSAGYLSAT